MNYETARERLEKPINKTSKQLGFKLTLRKETERAVRDSNALPATTYVIKYYSTDILTFYPKGFEISAGGWTTNRFTLDKLNEYMPKGDRLTIYDRYSKGRKDGSLGILSRRDDKWNVLGRYPFAANTLFTSEGREDLDRMNKYDAVSVREKVEHYAETLVEDFLHGKIDHPVELAGRKTRRSDQEDQEEALADLRRLMSRMSLDPETEETALNVLGNQYPRGMVMSMFLTCSTRDSHRYLSRGFWKDAYPHTTTVRTNKKLAAQLEYFLRHGKVMRPAGNSEEFRDFRRDLRRHLEDALFRGLGFELL